jgi:two-component system nitrate/nitrite sensor histidine kinase NarX
MLLFGALGFVLHFQVSQPLRDLQSGLPQESLAIRSDEIGVVARRLLEQGKTLEIQEQEAVTRRRNFRALVSISESLDDSISVERIFRTALGTIQEVTGFSTVAMRFYDTTQDCFRLVVQNGMSTRMVKELQCVTAEFPLYNALMETRRVVHLSSEASLGSLEIHPSAHAEGYRTALCVPLISGDRILGSMELGSRVPLSMSEDQIRWLEVVGRVIGGLLHQVELLERLRSMAMQQERSHVAQEIHDGLIQMLGALHLWAEEAQMAMDEGDTRTVQSAVRKIETTANDAYSSLREEMLGLRDTLQTGKGILPVMREYLKRFQREWGIETKLLVDNPDETETAIIKSPAVEIQLLRMIQEGLTNVRRHSRATCVQVVFRRRDQALDIEIIDNGVGFDQNNIQDEKLGLRIMRERADQIGGRVSVLTTPGQGTHLKIEVPR